MALGQAAYAYHGEGEQDADARSERDSGAHACARAPRGQVLTTSGTMIHYEEVGIRTDFFSGSRWFCGRRGGCQQWYRCGALLSR